MIIISETELSTITITIGTGAINNHNNNNTNNRSNNLNNNNPINIWNQFDGIGVLRTVRNNRGGRLDDNWTGEGLESRWDN